MSWLYELLSPILGWYTKRQSQKNLPNYDLGAKISALKVGVEVVRDKNGLPHIYAQNQEDLFLVQGFVHGQDRLWQMEIFRRIAKGRLSELFGKKTLAADRVLRTLGFYRLAATDAELYKNLPDKNAPLFALLDNYAKGVNEAIAEQARKMPPEFKLTGCKPEPWTVLDSLAIARFLAFQMSFGWLHQIEKMALIQAVGAEKAAELMMEHPEGTPVVLPNGLEKYEWKDGRLSAFDDIFLRPMGGSNSWVIAANKMSDGQSAVLSNDPHLVLSNPNIWVENHLSCPNYECTGVSAAGMPFVIIGHNRKIAWGVTLSFVDVQDLFIERFITPEGKQYEFGDEIRRAQQIEEVIKVKGQREPHIEKVIYTHHGPVISDAMGDGKIKLALASPALQVNEMILGFYNINNAGNWNEFVAAAAQIQSPSLNVSYADTSDNIGYYCTGKVPIRKTNKNGLPVSGFDTLHEWTGFIPATEMPHAFNPACGYLFHCNNKITDEKYPHDLGNLFMNSARATRLKQLFESQSSYSMEDCRRWQNDIVSTAAQKWVALFVSLQNQLESKDKNVVAACKLVAEWNCELAADSPAAAIYHVVQQTLIEQILGADISSRLRGKAVGEGLFKHSEFWGHDTDTTYRVLTRAKSAWRAESTLVVLERALVAACAWLKQELGESPTLWHWGKLHQITFEHVLGAQKPFDRWFNISNIAVGGDKDTLNQQSFMPNKAYGGTVCGASYRQIIDMGNFNNSFNIVPLGQSGNFSSPYYRNQLELWRNGKYKDFLWSREQILTQATHKANFTS